MDYFKLLIYKISKLKFIKEVKVLAIVMYLN